MNKKMYYVTGLDVDNTKQCFNFIKDHFRYWTMNPWNRIESIANNVKLYNLDLDGDWTDVLDFLNTTGYDDLYYFIKKFEDTHEGYRVGFGGRSGGYLVLRNSCNYQSIVPDYIEDSETYEDFKNYCKQYGGLCYYRAELGSYAKLIRDFDKLCDDLRDYVNTISIMLKIVKTDEDENF